MTEHLVIREARASDAEQVAALYEVLNGKPCRVLPDRIACIASDSSNFLYVAEKGGHVVGTAFLTLCLDPMYGYQPFAVAENIVITESQRNGGIGSQLLSFIERKCIEADCSKIMLLSSVGRTEAHTFFRARGYSSDAKLGFVKYRSRLSGQTESAQLSLGADGPASASLVQLRS